jgi:hypothetical protein
MAVGGAVQSCPFANRDEEQDPEKKWIQFQIKDKRGNPVSGVVLRLKLSDGSIQETTSGDNGMIHIANVPDGNCEMISDWKNFEVHNSVFIN